MMEQSDPNATRASLLGRLGTDQDGTAWEEFERQYRFFIHHICREMGLTEEDSKDARQEVMTDLARKLPEFEYDPDRGRFRAWLRRRVQWKVWDQVKRRLHGQDPLSAAMAEKADADFPERSDDPDTSGFERMWNREWECHALRLAKDAVKRRVNIRSFQVYDLLAVKELSAKEVAELFGISQNNAYKIRHDVEAMLSQELLKLKE